MAGVETEVALFVMSLTYSDAVYCKAFPRECTETFQEGHVRAVAIFGGVPRWIAYDNAKTAVAKTAVAKIVTSRDRTLTDASLKRKSHDLFELHFCLVRRLNEKRHVERLVDYARSSVLEPVPAVNLLEQMNEQLAERCSRDQS